MFLIVGLGNPGRQYEFTRHNAGFLAADRLAAQAGFEPPARFRSSLASRGRPAGSPAILAWPQTYMNLSGRAVFELASYYKIPGRDILILHDEMDLPPGRLKISFGGGAAGHRGLLSILNSVKDDFCRLRIGIGRPPQGLASADYALNVFYESERPAMDEALNQAAEAALIWAGQGLAAAQNKINRRPVPPAPGSGQPGSGQPGSGKFNGPA